MPVAESSRGRTTPELRDTATRVSSLDSIRGLAALSVVLCHYLIFLRVTAFGHAAWQWLWIPPLSLLSTAYGSVILFFVLSGYVLALSLVGGSNQGWLVFAIRRLFRIWPAYAITIAISFVICRLRGAPEPVEALVNQLAMTTSHISLDMPGWSLVHELRISLAFPLLLLCVQRAPTTTLFASFIVHLAGRFGPPWLTDLVPDTAIYVVFFSAGAWLAIHRTRMSEVMQFAPLSRALICVTGLVLLSVPENLAWSGTLAGVGASAIIVCATTSPAMASALSARWCEILGRVSYSLYLTHVVVLLTLVKLLSTRIPAELILLVAAPIIAIVAAAGYYGVELPSMRAGRSVARRLGKGMAAAGLSKSALIPPDPLTAMNTFDSEPVLR